MNLIGKGTQTARGREKPGIQNGQNEGGDYQLLGSKQQHKRDGAEKQDHI